MDNNKARWLLENLLERLADRGDGKRELPGIITEGEIKALVQAMESLGGEEVPAEEALHGVKTVSEVEPSRGTDMMVELESASRLEPTGPQTKESYSGQELRIEIDDSILDGEPVSPDFRLCIDFGTAMSKVTLVHDAVGHDGGDEIRVLPLGDIVGQDPADGPLELLISSVYISNDGSVYFGKDAMEVADQEGGDGDRQRIDNMKRFLSEDGIEQVLGEEFNPTGIEIEYYDIVLFYLAYLTWAINQCTDSLGYDRNICRRFAMPCFDNGKSRQYFRMLSKMLGDAQLVADTLGEDIKDGVPLSQLKAVCDDVRARGHDYPFVGSPVTEPLGVASALVSEDGAANNLSLVIDIGAGTTDMSLFRIRVDPSEERYVAHQIPGASCGLTMAGNYIDRVLIQSIISRAELVPQSPEYRRVRNDLERKVRIYKEELFDSGSVDVPLQNGDVVELTLNEFLASSTIQKFKQELHDKILEILNGVDDFYLKTAPRNEVVLVLTGGGATLPFVRSMVGETFEVGNVSVKAVKSFDFPEWLQEDHADLEPIFSRIAVSLGGARENVIQPYDKGNTGRELA
ncbi:hypothetical protein HBJ58_20740 [Halomonas desiderata]|uniref:hypothetical protein n=1 Tax=Billgrantia desiderata TaxID=52021 RepID=UPI00174E5FE5|nr:hypothetical protein [Halomonas desiderata]